MACVNGVCGVNRKTTAPKGYTGKPGFSMINGNPNYINPGAGGGPGDPGGPGGPGDPNRPFQKFNSPTPPPKKPTGGNVSTPSPFKYTPGKLIPGFSAVGGNPSFTGSAKGIKLTPDQLKEQIALFKKAYPNADKDRDIEGIEREKANMAAQGGSFGDKVYNALFGQPGKQFNILTGTPEQVKAREQLLAQVLPQLIGKVGGAGQFKPEAGINQLMTQLLNPKPGADSFAPIEKQARQQFAQQTVPSLAERFTASSGSSKQGSSAFQGSLGQAASGLESQLASLRSQYGLQERGQSTRENLAQQNLLSQLLGTQQGQLGGQQNLLLSLLGQGLQSPFQPMYQQPTGGLLGGLAGGLGQGLGSLGTLGLGKLLGGF